MTISVWRYSHLILAVSSFILLTLASITGIILAFQPVSERLHSYRADQFDSITLAQSLPQLRDKYPGISELSVDSHQSVLIKGTDADGEKLLSYVDPGTGKLLGVPEPKSEFFEWVTALHRSLFLKETGRFFIGLTSFLLLLITISGTMLVIQRQQGLKRFFTSIVRENFAQYYHVVLGRLSLIPIFVIALSGTYLSLVRFELIKSPIISSDVDFDAIKTEPEKKATDFEIFKTVYLSDVKSVEFPFSEDPEDYFTLKLTDKEVTVNQITGDILTEVKYPTTAMFTELSLDLHTGRTNIVWAIVLAVASGNILFFIYSGFAITLKRRKNRVRNNFTADESEFVILVGSENGSTFGFANAIGKQLMAAGKSAYVTELNNYKVFPKAEHIIVMTATYGLGNPPTNGTSFEKLLEKHPQNRNVRYSVLGFGSHAYPDFCKFAFEADNLLAKQKWAVPLLEIHTINDKSPEEFGQWASTWSQHADIPLEVSAELITRQEPMQSFSVVEKTMVAGPGESFLMKLRINGDSNFTSGDLLAIYPANDHRERLYSIGKIGNDIQLGVKLHEHGIGSEFLYKLDSNTVFDARIVENGHFHFPSGVPSVMMISNGTGIAPFLGMIDHDCPETKRFLYCGFRDKASFALYEKAIKQSEVDGKLASLQVAYSREGEKQYVKDLLIKDQELVAGVLAGNGVIMLCGSLSMQKNVIELIDHICETRLGKDVSYYQSHGQILMDCY
ncbi:PepSY domain-containing protein [Dyadobacter sp. CY312]|uniref:PepSY domain-containing protein n=1 Tax=Dyadobacter sp. CY312 TaxID=2907303 RepID=UPI001F3988CA|nr:PepSY domain-containing protein [Dyadobacter sp. CY312]MCE7039042.1 PepSY domain-containing protein [Dyadobacter sp. CY312]